jgi:nitroreductase/NAD-dependent dihydropyrimidine dehydrogenase PreA subunit
MIIHNIQNCIGCGVCIKACSRQNFSIASGRVSLQPMAVDNCLGCGHCLAVCPVDGALSLSEYENDELEPYPVLPDEKVVLDLIRSRRSIRCYQDVVPSQTQIARLLEAARYAPSGHNSQDFGFIVVYCRERIKVIGECTLGFYRRLVRLLDNPLGRRLVRLAAGRGTFETLTTLTPRLKRHIAIYQESGRIEMVWNASCLILVHGPDKPDSVVNAVLAGYNIMLHAHSMGLGTCILGLLKAGLERVGHGFKKTGLQFPSGHKVHLIISVGLPQKGLSFCKIPPRREPSVLLLGESPT